MLRGYALPKQLKQLSPKISWRLCTLSFLLCSIILIPHMFMPIERVLIALLLISVAALAWIFRIKLLYLCIGGVILTLLLFLCWIGKLIWPSSILLSSLLGGEILLAEAFVVSCLRTAMNVAVGARQQKILADQQMALALERQQHLNELKDQFLLNVSHELRTPLTEVKGYLELLRENYTQLDADSMREFLDHATHGCNELELLVDNVLEATQLDVLTTSYELSSVSLVKIVQETLEQIPHEDHEIVIDIPYDLAALAHRQQLKRVLYNLLSNAIKYSPTHTVVTVSATLMSGQLAACPDICFRVQDLGPGVPAADMPMLFQKVMRLKRDLTGSIRGTGLGLFISKQLVESMGGRIWVESTGIPGQGSCFCFTLAGAPITLLPLPLK
ncbi:hypothetical protein KDA_63620 [Dictyobacter alpinus]|uniref:histidine kinase n=1 Tax=Dictyobacter alpinus TaxID=2014873 RepID=A0A402BHI2_9CHLR|nr:HAMP domain-containing sensor histidine kinase [Dictyobacter alpinus]GCE30878.1 hypothetical protein KDA_63620 [Dictyobacter alpinus]